MVLTESSHFRAKCQSILQPFRAPKQVVVTSSSCQGTRVFMSRYTQKTKHGLVAIKSIRVR